jgi:hypothetical protein
MHLEGRVAPLDLVHRRRVTVELLEVPAYAADRDVRGAAGSSARTVANSSGEPVFTSVASTRRG